MGQNSNCLIEGTNRVDELGHQNEEEKKKSVDSSGCDVCEFVILNDVFFFLFSIGSRLKSGMFGAHWTFRDKRNPDRASIRNITVVPVGGREQ